MFYRGSTMVWSNEVAYFFGGAFAANAIPHWVSGLMGRAFQSPFAKPPGQGLSSSMVNVFWAWFNLIAAYLLIFRVGAFEARSAADVVPVALGAFLLSVALARSFGRFNGGDLTP
jgi:hypothetical protein